MHIVIISLAFLLLILGPGLWVKSVMARYSYPADRYAKSGGDVARELLNNLGLQKVVRLSPANFDGHSLTAIAVSAHEVGHALQDAKGFKPLQWRTRLVRWVGPFEKLGAGMLMVAPFTLALTRVPVIGLLTFVGGMLSLGSGAAIHFLTLPTEFDASFGRALPLLDRQRLLKPGDKIKARRLLTAAALTYVAGSLTSLLNIARWWAILRR